VRVTRAGVYVAIVIAAGADVTAQSRATGFQPRPQLFGRLFAANRTCSGCEDRPGQAHFVMDSPRLTEEWLARHEYQSNGGSYGDNAAFADLWYDAVHRRLFSRSLVLHEVGDPADLRLGRAPGRYPNDPDFTALLPSGETVGHIGFVRWSQSGFSSYFAAMQGAVRDVLTGYLDLSTATGVPGKSRSGSTYTSEELVKHVRLHPSGQLEIGFDTDPEARPESSLLVRGNVQIEGTLMVGGSSVGEPPPAPVLACSMRTATGRGRAAMAACDVGQVATGGGGTCASGEMRASRPLLQAETPAGWEVTCSRDGAHTVQVICCVR
jgi:hypothetical protein